ncbi:PQQ-binding-like beta-propeller repeat protein [Streptomyces sp. SID13726]|uniref:outer membrane protein assembly factor BamB family protein n=1 Tax=Streptomyces sp. SID13726 TaxID=2706058 RepID=UPI0013B6CFE2|nr:PQQ-binding-like beta-propeller repeat protein [Streptomyces sp. SID13726]NEB03075.1 PQQ-binding-like beta-propeller repeat protein [Streptomyces sp. SID13726]
MRTRTRTVRWWAWVGPIGSAPYVHDGTVYAVGLGTWAFDAADGTHRWHNGDVGRLSSPTVSGDTVHLAGEGRYGGFRFFALDTADGRVRWRRRTTSVSLTPPAVADGLVHHVDGGRHLSTFDAATGQRRRRVRYRRPGVNLAGPVLADGTLYAVDDRSTVWALDPATGAVHWQRPTSAHSTGTPLVHDGTLYLGGGVRPEVHALDAGTGEQRWSVRPQQARSDFRATPAIQGDTLYVAGDSHLYALNAATGEERWRAAADSDIRSAPALSDGTVSLVVAAGLVHVACENGCVYTLDA